ncbi:MAG: hypothetical protein WDO14_24975 [Bacteroidota bacterium]
MTDNAIAFFRPILSLINPQVKPPMVQPPMYTATMIPAMSVEPPRSRTTIGRYVGMSVEINPANTLLKKQMKNESQREIPIRPII